MKDKEFEDYRDDLVSFLKKKEDDIVQRSRVLKVTNVFVLVIYKNIFV